MSQNEPAAFFGNIFEDYTVLSVEDLSRMCTVDRRHIEEMVEEGILDVMQDGDGGEWHFAGANLRRARLALRLQRDLEINLAGAALALELIEEIEQLRRELRRELPHNR